jgi:hypothetical protein
LPDLEYSQTKKVPERCVYVDVNQRVHLAVNSSFYRRTRPADFCIKTIKLATVLSQYSPTLFCSMFENFIPEILCLKMIQDESLSHILRSCIIDFYIASYLESKCIGLDKTLKYNSQHSNQKRTDRLRILEKDFGENYIKINEEIRISVVQSLSQNLEMDQIQLGLTKSVNSDLSKYLFDYLNNPENYIKIEPRLVESFINLLNFFLDRGFLVVQDIAYAKMSIFNFLKYFLSTQYKHKLKKLIDLLSVRKNAIKGEDNMERDTVKGEEEEKNEDKIEPKYMRFISKMIDCLGRLEKTIFDLKFEYLIH